MNDRTLNAFRQIASDMGIGGDWQWIGKYDSQRMFGLSEDRAKAYASKYGGEARRMPDNSDIVAQSIGKSGDVPSGYDRSDWNA